MHPFVLANLQDEDIVHEMDEIATAKAIDANMDAHTGCNARSNPECRPDVTQECALESEEAEHQVHLSGLDH